MYSLKNTNKPRSEWLYKTRLVADGGKQVQGVDYDETFSPTVSHITLRMVLAIAAKRAYHLAQMDVKTAFLNVPLKEEVYVELPLGYKGPLGGPKKLWSLKRALYGLRQAPCEWYLTFKNALEEMDFKPCSNEPSLHV